MAFSAPSLGYGSPEQDKKQTNKQTDKTRELTTVSSLDTPRSLDSLSSLQLKEFSYVCVVYNVQKF